VTAHVSPPAAPHNAEAIAAVLAVQPHWIDMTTLGHVLEDQFGRSGDAKVILHAGPPFTGTGDIPPPVLNSAAQMATFEGWAGTRELAVEQILSGGIEMRAAQDFDCVVPLAGVITPSMALHVIGDPNTGAKLFAAVNEGMDHLLRTGMVDPSMHAHHRWINTELTEFFNGALAASAGIDLFPLLARSLEENDDGHSRTVAGSRLLAETLRAISPQPPSDRVEQFLTSAAALALNLWMGAVALSQRAAERFPEADLVTRVGGNGCQFGLQFAGQPGRWHCVAGTPPAGDQTPCVAGHLSVLPAIGDSAVVDFFGLGGGAVKHAPAVQQSVADHLPPSWLRDCASTFEAEHPVLPVRTAVSRSRIAAGAQAPVVLLGMIEQSGEHGRIGGGVYATARELFTTE
jgi:Protein of unknown function (DUF1116)